MRTLLTLLIVSLVGVIGWYLFEPQERLDIPSIGVAIGDDEIMSLSDIHLVQKKENMVKAELAARKAVILTDGVSAEVKDFTLLTRQRKESPLWITGGTGNLNTNSLDVKAHGTIVIQDQRGNGLVTERLELNQKNATIFSDGEIFVFGEGFVIRGAGLTIDTEHETVEIHRDVTMVLFPAEKR